MTKLLEKLCCDGIEFKKLSEIATIDIGEFVRQDRQGDDKPYPVFNGGRSFTGKYDDFNRDGEYILISARGNAGFVNYFNGKYWAGNSCYSINVNQDIIEAKFAYYFLKSSEQNLMKLQQKGVISAISKQQISDFKIPIPPIKIQTEIVRILDSLSDSIDELVLLLEKELTLRKKQYEYYRDQLLTFSEIKKESR